jgi:hypothetical protein
MGGIFEVTIDKDVKDSKIFKVAPFLELTEPNGKLKMGLIDFSNDKVSFEDRLHFH